MSFRFFDRDTQLWSIYWADTRRLGVLDPPVFGGFDGDTGVFEGEDTFEGRPDPRPLHVVGRDHADAALGAGLLRGRRRDMGDELGDGLHAGGGTPMSVLERDRSQARLRHSSKLVRPEARLTLGEVLLKWYDIAPAEAPVPLAVRALARRNLRDGAKSGTLALSGELGFVILHRCGESFYFLIVVHLAQRQRALADRLGEGRRRRDRVPPVGGRRDTPADVLRLGARRRLARATGVEPIPAQLARRVREGDLPARLLRRGDLKAYRKAARTRRRIRRDAARHGVGDEEARARPGVVREARLGRRLQVAVACRRSEPADAGGSRAAGDVGLHARP